MRSWRRFSLAFLRAFRFGLLGVALDGTEYHARVLESPLELILMELSLYLVHEIPAGVHDVDHGEYTEFCYVNFLFALLTVKAPFTFRCVRHTWCGFFPSGSAL